MGLPILNSGVLAFRRGAPAVSKFLEMWEARVIRVLHAFHTRNRSAVPKPPADCDGHRFDLRHHRLKHSDDEDVSYGPFWETVVNDQFTLAQLVTVTHVHPELRGLRRVNLPVRFNWRSNKPNRTTAVVVNHRGHSKSLHVREVLMERGRRVVIGKSKRGRGLHGGRKAQGRGTIANRPRRLRSRAREGRGG